MTKHMYSVNTRGLGWCEVVCVGLVGTVVDVGAVVQVGTVVHVMICVGAVVHVMICVGAVVHVMICVGAVVHVGICVGICCIWWCYAHVPTDTPLRHMRYMVCGVHEVCGNNSIKHTRTF